METDRDLIGFMEIDWDLIGFMEIDWDLIGYNEMDRDLKSVLWRLIGIYNRFYED